MGDNETISVNWTNKQLILLIADTVEKTLLLLLPKYCLYQIKVYITHQQLKIDLTLDMSLSKPTRPDTQLLDIPWGTLDKSWNAKELEAMTAIQRSWQKTLKEISAIRTIIKHEDVEQPPRIATFQKVRDDQLLPLAALGGKSNYKNRE